MTGTAPSPCLRAGSLQLRPYGPADAQALCEAVRESVDTVGRWLPWCHAGYGADEAQAWIVMCQAGWRDGDQFAFGIHDDEGFIGGVGINRVDDANRSGNLGYWVRQARHGHGLAWRAARRLASWAFAELRLLRLEIVCAEHNHASRRTAEKIGARLEGLARHRLVLHDAPLSAAVYGLVPSDIEPLGD